MFYSIYLQNQSSNQQHMNSIKLQPIITSLNIDYQRGQSLTLEVNAEIKQKQQRFLIWSIVLIAGLIQYRV